MIYMEQFFLFMNAFVLIDIHSPDHQPEYLENFDKNNFEGGFLKKYNKANQSSKSDINLPMIPSQ